MVSPAVSDSNRASWVDVLAFVRGFPDDDTWTNWKRDVLSLLEAGVAEKLDGYYRAGQSMQHIVFSTAEKHGLEYMEPQPPRVTVGFNKDMSLFVAWSDLNIWFNEPTRRDSLGGETGFDTLKRYLRDLWISTRPSEPLPPGLAKPI